MSSSFRPNFNAQRWYGTKTGAAVLCKFPEVSLVEIQTRITFQSKQRGEGDQHILFTALLACLVVFSSIV